MTSPGSQPLAPQLLEEAADMIGRIANRQRAAVALVGGFALQHFGSSRLTGDIDVISSAPLHELEPAKPLSFGGQRAAVLVPGNASIGTHVLVPVDVIVRTDDFAELYADALDHAFVAGLHEPLGRPAAPDKRAPLPIVEPEYLAAMKMAAGRRKDQDDLAFLITAAAIDLPKAERIIRKHLGAYAIKEFRTFVAETAWLASRSDE